MKLGFIIKFRQEMDRNNTAFKYLKNKFPRINDAKIKEGIFVGPQIRELKLDVKFEYQLTEVEKTAWKSFWNVATNFWGNHIGENYRWFGGWSCTILHSHMFQNNNQHDDTCGLSFIFMGSRHSLSTCFELSVSSSSGVHFSLYSQPLV